MFYMLSVVTVTIRCSKNNSRGF